METVLEDWKLSIKTEDGRIQPGYSFITLDKKNLHK